MGIVARAFVANDKYENLLDLQIASSLQQAREELDQVKEELAAAKAHTDQVGFPRPSGLPLIFLLVSIRPCFTGKLMSCTSGDGFTHEGGEYCFEAIFRSFGGLWVMGCISLKSFH